MAPSTRNRTNLSRSTTAASTIARSRGIEAKINSVTETDRGQEGSAEAERMLAPPQLGLGFPSNAPICEQLRPTAPSPPTRHSIAPLVSIPPPAQTARWPKHSGPHVFGESAFAQNRSGEGAQATP